MPLHECGECHEETATGVFCDECAALVCRDCWDRHDCIGEGSDAGMTLLIREWADDAASLLDRYHTALYRLTGGDNHGNHARDNGR